MNNKEIPGSGPDQIPTITAEDAERINVILRAIGGPSVMWGARDSLEVWLVEQRMRADRETAQTLTRATQLLVLVTAVLALATIVLVVATFSV